MQDEQQQQAPPNWGVMFSDGSVMHPWNGRTQKDRAIRALDRIRDEYPGDRIDLAYRPSPGEPWRRIEDEAEQP